MKLEVRISAPGAAAERTRSVELERKAGRLRVRIGDRVIEADAVEVATGTYSILLGGRAYEVRVQPGVDGLRVHAGGREFAAQVIDPRVWRGRRAGVLEVEGRQQIIAPMPGKIVRVLVQAGESIEAGQGMLVVEAMKMQNEVRSPKTGKVERVLVTEGQAVNAGEVLAVVS